MRISLAAPTAAVFWAFFDVLPVFEKEPRASCHSARWALRTSLRLPYMPGSGCLVQRQMGFLVCLCRMIVWVKKRLAPGRTGAACRLHTDGVVKGFGVVIKGEKGGPLAISAIRIGFGCCRSLARPGPVPERIAFFSRRSAFPLQHPAKMSTSGCRMATWPQDKKIPEGEPSGMPYQGKIPPARARRQRRWAVLFPRIRSTFCPASRTWAGSGWAGPGHRAGTAVPAWCRRS